MPAVLSDGPAQSGQRFLTLYGLKPLRAILPLLSLLYALGVCWYCGKMIIALLGIKSLRKNNAEPGHELKESFRRLCVAVLPGKKVSLQLSLKAKVPMMLGHFKPLVLLPFSLVNHLSLQQVEAVLLHELAHLKRKDYLFNVIQTVLETFLFFNPFARLLSAAIRREREHCCDDFVLAHTASSLSYAHALLTLETERRAFLSPAMAATGASRSSLFNRIKRITEMKNPAKKPQKTLATLTVVLLIAAMACFFTAFSQSFKKQAHPSSKKATPVSTVPSVASPNLSPQKATVLEPVAKPEDHYNAAKAGNEDSLSIDNSGVIQQAMQQAGTALKVAGTQMASIPWDSIGKGISESFSSIDWDSIDAAMTYAMNDMDSNMSAQMAREHVQFRGQIKEQRRQMNKKMREARAQMQEARKQMQEARKQMNAAREEMLKASREMHKEIGRQAPKAPFSGKFASYENGRPDSMRLKHLKTTSVNMPEIKAAIHRMQQQGLLKKDETFTIHILKGHLTINGKDQADAVYDQYYRKLLQDNTEIIIKNVKNKLIVEAFG
jgi:beta-lactamase regulating signal transducer with metallopeptidase domain